MIGPEKVNIGKLVKNNEMYTIFQPIKTHHTHGFNADWVVRLLRSSRIFAASCIFCFTVRSFLFVFFFAILPYTLWRFKIASVLFWRICFGFASEAKTNTYHIIPSLWQFDIIHTENVSHCKFAKNCVFPTPMAESSMRFQVE